MAVLNIYDFHGKTTTTVDSDIGLLSPQANETFIVKSIRVTNKSGTILKYSTAGTMTNGVDIGISYLNIKKEVTT